MPFQPDISSFEKAPQVPRDKRRRQLSKRAKRRCELDGIAHSRLPIIERLELVRVFQMCEWPARLLVYKTARRLELRDVSRQLQPQPEVNGGKRHPLARANQSFDSPRNGALTRVGGQTAVQTDVARRVEAGFNRGADEGLRFDAGYDEVGSLVGLVGEVIWEIVPKVRGS